MTLLLLPVLPYFSQLYLIKMDISWNISNLREVSWPEMHLRTCFPLVEVIFGPKMSDTPCKLDIFHISWNFPYENCKFETNTDWATEAWLKSQCKIFISVFKAPCACNCPAYSSVPNKRTGRLLILGKFFHPIRSY